MTREIRVLNVAEKPSVAREIARHLGGGGASWTSMPGGSSKAEFPYLLRHHQCRMTTYAVRGHMLEIAFTAESKNWKSQPPSACFAAELQQRVISDCQDLERNLKQLSRQAEWLVLWLDCDREGEAIAFEVMKVCQEAAGGRLQVFRAVFSALTRADLVNACNTLRLPDQGLADAVEARQEVDLRAGAAFTRWLTIRYHDMFPELKEQVLSYGPCQFPTLGFVVERWLRIQRFVPEPFWSIRAEVNKAGQPVRFAWRRGRLFDRLAVLALYELCAEGAVDGAVVVRVVEEPKSRWRPLPLNTVELGKLGASKLRMAPATCLQVAEGLYQRGIISYPRTETDRFGPTIDVRGLVAAQSTSSVWGGYVQVLLAGRFTVPRQGARDDHAHPPIHPVRVAERAELDEGAWRVYELVTRHFLACCSPDARGNRTEVEITIDAEAFVTAGVNVTDRGWFEIYPYSNWVNDPLPAFVMNEVLPVSALEMTESRTQPPPLLSEADLIALMDRNGIGTDATMHDHIDKIQHRQYATKNAEGRLEPTRLGAALIEGFQRFAVEEGLDLSKPVLRARMENGMTAIAQGQRQKQEFVNWCIHATQRCYTSLEQNAAALDATLGQHFTGQAAHGRAAPVEQPAFSRCRCGAMLDLKCQRLGGGAAPAAAGAGAAPGRARGGRGRGARGRGAAKAAARGAAPARGRGRAAAGRFAAGFKGKGRGKGGGLPPRLERFLVCPNGECGIVLPVPGNRQVRPHSGRHICPICGFQVLTLHNQETGRDHNICPYCFNHVPRDLHPDMQELRCFQCAHPTCALAGGRRAGPAGGGGGPGSGPSGSARADGPPHPAAGPAPPALGQALFPCSACGGQGQMMLRQHTEGPWSIQCSQHPACQNMRWLPQRVLAAALDGQCQICSPRYNCEVRTMCLRVASAVPAGGSAPGNPGAPAAPADVLPGVCVAGCNNTLAQLGA
mmetsp:Transcript_64036/g.111565  ORF Transcript_64036/g.111565 Transcript_64036/m.111565 type:complete len:957 (-) Transcript_64036:70-2940(-)